MNSFFAECNVQPVKLNFDVLSTEIRTSGWFGLLVCLFSRLIFLTSAGRFCGKFWTGCFYFAPERPWINSRTSHARRERISSSKIRFTANLCLVFIIRLLDMCTWLDSFDISQQMLVKIISHKLFSVILHNFPRSWPRNKLQRVNY